MDIKVAESSGRWPVGNQTAKALYLFLIHRQQPKLKTKLKTKAPCPSAHKVQYLFHGSFKTSEPELQDFVSVTSHSTSNFAEMGNSISHIQKYNRSIWLTPKTHQLHKPLLLFLLSGSLMSWSQQIKAWHALGSHHGPVQPSGMHECKPDPQVSHRTLLEF